MFVDELPTAGTAFTPAFGLGLGGLVSLIVKPFPVHPGPVELPDICIELSDFGHFFIAKNHENLRSYLIETRDDRSIITMGKLYQNQRLSNSKVNRLYH